MLPEDPVGAEIYLLKPTRLGVPGTGIEPVLPLRETGF
jgi:hypothetical protein